MLLAACCLLFAVVPKYKHSRHATPIIGFVLFVIPGIVVTIRYGLSAPVVLMEGLEKKAALRRARELASRSWRTVIIIMLLQILIPMSVSRSTSGAASGNGACEPA